MVMYMVMTGCTILLFVQAILIPITFLYLSPAFFTPPTFPNLPPHFPICFIIRVSPYPQWHVPSCHHDGTLRTIVVVPVFILEFQCSLCDVYLHCHDGQRTGSKGTLKITTVGTNVFFCRYAFLEIGIINGWLSICNVIT